MNGNPINPRRRPPALTAAPCRRRRGFTLLEAMLASALAGLVAMGVLSVLYTAERVDRVSRRVLDRSAMVANTQRVQQQAFLNLLLADASVRDDVLQELGIEDSPTGEEQSFAGTDRRLESEDPTKRSRLILEEDPYVSREGGGVLGPAPQRLEVVLTRPPVPSGLVSFYSTTETSSLENEETYTEPAGGLRGVFEVRRDGQRERFMEKLGWVLMDPGHAMEMRRADDRLEEGWSLWWRPMSYEEVEELASGQEPTDQVTASRLAQSVRLASGLSTVGWSIFADRQDKTEFRAIAAADVPGYAKLYLESERGLYAELMFEMGWKVGDDPNAPIAEEQAAAEAAANGGPGLGPAAAVLPQQLTPEQVEQLRRVLRDQGGGERRAPPREFRRPDLDTPAQRPGGRRGGNGAGGGR